MIETDISNKEGLRLCIQHWQVAGPRAVVALVHGQGEHIGRYGHVAAFYNAHQVAVMGYDQQGFGKSAGNRGHAANFDAYLDDLDLFLNEVKNHYPGTPIILRGHSMGGNVVLNYVLRRHPAFLKGVVVTAPWIRLAFEPPAIKVWAGRLLRGILPKLTLPTGLDVTKISRDPEVVRRYQVDPLVHDKVSAAAGIDLMEAASWLDHYTGPAPCPVLLMHGGDDAITSVTATRAFQTRLTGDTTYQEWPGLYHEIHNEPSQKSVLDLEWQWVSSKI